MKEVTTVVDPSGLTWSVPTSCSNNIVWPNPSSPTITGKDPVSVESYLVAKGFG